MDGFHGIEGLVWMRDEVDGARFTMANLFEDLVLVEGIHGDSFINESLFS